MWRRMRGERIRSSGITENEVKEVKEVWEVKEQSQAQGWSLHPAFCVGERFACPDRQVRIAGGIAMLGRVSTQDLRVETGRI